jgi:hypothetical protein
MTSIKTAACAFILLLGALASATADAHRVRFGFHFGFPVFPPYWYYAPPPVYYYPPPVVAAPAAPPVYVERNHPPSAAPPAEHYWYYCADTQAYYPYVQECRSEWQRVSPRPPGM